MSRTGESVELDPADLVVIRVALDLLRSRCTDGTPDLSGRCMSLLDVFKGARWVEVGRD